MAATPKKPVMDVSKPGKTPADATTRPIISGHEIMKDPMVNEEPDKMEGVTVDVKTSDDPKEEIAVPTTSHKVIQPISRSEENQEETKEESAETLTEEADADPKPSEDEKQETAVTEDAVVDAVLDQVGDKKEETKESEEDRKRQEQVDKLVEEKKYFVPIAQERKRRNNRLVLLVLGALLPVVVGLGLAADAGAINLGFKVPFDFIKDRSPQTTQTQATITNQPKAEAQKVLYKSKVDALSFSYPTTWKISSQTFSGSPEFNIFEPKPAASGQLSNIRLQFTRLAPTAGFNSYPNQTIESLTYTDFKTGDKQLYVRELVYSSTTKQYGKRYSVMMALVDQKDMEKLGGNPSGKYNRFLAADNKTEIEFQLQDIILGDDSKNGFSTLEKAQAFMASDKDYKDAKAVLMSIKLK
jgi:hypothetical protein